jgi:hypothetical protein
MIAKHEFVGLEADCLRCFEPYEHSNHIQHARGLAVDLIDEARQDRLGWRRFWLPLASSISFLVSVGCGIVFLLCGRWDIATFFAVCAFGLAKRKP